MAYCSLKSQRKRSVLTASVTISGIRLPRNLVEQQHRYIFFCVCDVRYAPQNRVVNGPHFEAQTRPQLEITSPNPAQDRHLFLKPDLGRKAKFTE